MEEFLDQSHSENIVTPESLAWNLLIDEDVKDYEGVLMPNVVNDPNSSTQSGQGKNMLYEQLSDQFQILISMYMEMVFGLLKINHISANMNEHGDISDEIDLDKTFKPDLSKFTVDDMLLVFREKFKKIRYFLSVQEIYDANSSSYGSSAEYYCRILLKDTPEGKTHFWNNRHNPAIDPEKRYTFLMRNDKEKSHRELKNFYAVCTLPNIKVRISFSPLNIIVQ